MDENNDNMIQNQSAERINDSNSTEEKTLYIAKSEKGNKMGLVKIIPTKDGEMIGNGRVLQENESKINFKSKSSCAISGDY